MIDSYIVCFPSKKEVILYAFISMKRIANLLFQTKNYNKTILLII